MKNVKSLELHDRVIIPKVRVASDFISRFVGFMGRKQIGNDEAVLFPKCNSIHTFFMRTRIDVVLIGEKGMVVELKEQMSPWLMMMPRRKVKHVLEIRSGLAKELGIQVGSQLRCNGVLV